MISYRLTAEIENLMLQGGADMQGSGNALANMITGNAGGNLLDGMGGHHDRWRRRRHLLPSMMPATWWSRMSARAAMRYSRRSTMG